MSFLGYNILKNYLGSYIDYNILKNYLGSYLDYNILKNYLGSYLDHDYTTLNHTWVIIFTTGTRGNTWTTNKNHLYTEYI